MRPVTLALLLALTSLLPAAAEPHPHTPSATVLSLAVPTPAPVAEADPGWSAINIVGATRPPCSHTPPRCRRA